MTTMGSLHLRHNKGVHNNSFMYPQSFREIIRAGLERCCWEELRRLRDPRDQDVHVLHGRSWSLRSAVEVCLHTVVPAREVSVSVSLSLLAVAGCLGDTKPLVRVFSRRTEDDRRCPSASFWLTFGSCSFLVTFFLLSLSQSVKASLTYGISENIMMERAVAICSPLLVETNGGQFISFHLRRLSTSIWSMECRWKKNSIAKPVCGCVGMFETATRN